MGLEIPLYSMYIRYRGEIVPFAGYPPLVQYEEGVVAEHAAVREQRGFLGASHVDGILLNGPDALKNVDMLLTSDYTVMEDDAVRYNPMYDEAGGVVDSLIVYKIKDNSYFITINASNRDKDYQWVKGHMSSDVELEDISDQMGQLALQGPETLDVLKRVTKPDGTPDKYYIFKRDYHADGISYIISKTGYTGEDGVEAHTAEKDVPSPWELPLEAGREERLISCDLGARDTLCLEASTSLHGYEMDDTITSKETGFGIFVRMDKEDFIGKKALQGEGSLARKWVGSKVTGYDIIREHKPVLAGERQVGTTTSGTYCPCLGYPVVITLMNTTYKEPDIQVEVGVRDRRVGAEVVKLPFYKRRK